MNSRALNILAILAVVAGLYFGKEVLIPLALGVLLTFLLAPLANRLEGLHVPRVGAVLMVVLLAFGVIGVTAYLVTGQLYELASNLPEYKDNIKRKIEFIKPTGDGLYTRIFDMADEVRSSVATTAPAATQATQPADSALIDPASAAERLSILTPDGFNRAMSGALRTGTPIPVTVSDDTSPLTVVGTSLAVVLEPLATIGIVLVLVIFMLLEREQLRDRLIHLMGQGQVSITTRALDEAASRISRYLLAQAIVNGTYGIAVSIGLWVIGLTLGGETGFPNAMLWGLLCAMLRFVPYVGPWVGAALPMTLSIVLFDNFTVFIATASMFVVLELLSNNLMEPWLYGSSTGMSTVAVLAAAIFWAWLWGPIGLVLATPLTACIVVGGKYVPQLKFLNILLSDEPVFDPPTRIYQRLLARDRGEAHDLFEEFLEQHTLEEVYDDILIPALAMCEMDRHNGQMDDARADFVIREMGTIIQESGEQYCEVARSSNDMSRVLRPGRATFSGQPPVRVLSLPSHDEADEVICLMLTQLLRCAGYDASHGSVHKLAAERIQAVGDSNASIVVISALPPAAAMHVKYMLKRLHGQYPQSRLRTIVGLWRAQDDINATRERLERDPGIKLAGTLGESMEDIHEFSQQLILDKSETTGDRPA